MTVQPVSIRPPYLLFLGAAETNLGAKTATGVAAWRPEICAGQYRLPGCGADLGLPDLTFEEAAAQGVGSLVIGTASVGGGLPDDWVATFVAALEAGLDIASGLHARLAAVPAIAEAAARNGRALHDVRVPPAGLPCGTGAPRSGHRLLTVGTDCAVGKMFTALALGRDMAARGVAADFRATGQTGIFIAGSGMPVDAVVSDFLSGSVEVLCPAADPDHWDLIEGQGSLFHPAYAAVSLGLLHGAQAEALVLCHEAGRTLIDDGGYDGYALPSLTEAIAANEAAARITCPAARVVGIALNTRALGEAEARAALEAASAETGLPAIDPVRTGTAPILDALLGPVPAGVSA
ncbi:DUF1611 domain-containing protein [Paralimibaculum aggregatum]|uniref:DUF1611 domain-containing protein n=1 Tax=Paralimibaculum aggregatum TaxID=3036245 RepID=A0ABQ6LHQ4_9RHOB|nr:DUF1611 domain-containing protein [Limibaculum sp. NKW23]GMG82818.1 DUF1611 domain-containing protein [Limibaculum sp. NKW23]